MPLTYHVLSSPIGPLTLIRGPAGLRAIYFAKGGEAHIPEGATPVAEDPAADQLRAYFEGRLRVFDLDLDPQGTPFQRAVWDALLTIPFGETRTYSDIARAIGHPTAVRAVGAANGQNPLSIVVPCHRVIGKSGKLTGYAGGLDIKAQLLTLEGSRGPETLALPLRFGH